MVTRRRFEPLGIILATDDGLYHAVPGEESRCMVAGHRFTSIDYTHGVGIAVAAGVGAWVHAGRRWEQAWEGPARSGSVTPGGALFIGTADGGLLRSDDAGERWTELEGVRTLIKHNRFVPPPGERVPYVSSVVEAGEGILVGIAGAGGGGWHTRDGGNTWLRRSEGLDPKVHRLWAHPERRDRLYAATDSGLFRSEDEGYSWLQSIGGLDRSWAGTVAVLPGAPDTLILAVARDAPAGPDAPAMRGALFRSANGGVTWTRLGLGDYDEWERVPCVVRPWDWEDVAFASAGTGLWATHDRGRSWVSLGDGYPEVNGVGAAL